MTQRGRGNDEKEANCISPFDEESSVLLLSVILYSDTMWCMYCCTKIFNPCCCCIAFYWETQDIRHSNAWKLHLRPPLKNFSIPFYMADILQRDLFPSPGYIMYHLVWPLQHKLHFYIHYQKLASFFFFHNLEKRYQLSKKFFSSRPLRDDDFSSS